jgi:hypothetical protein
VFCELPKSELQTESSHLSIEEDENGRKLCSFIHRHCARGFESAAQQPATSGSHGSAWQPELWLQPDGSATRDFGHHLDLVRDKQWRWTGLKQPKRAGKCLTAGSLQPGKAEPNNLQIGFKPEVRLHTNGYAQQVTYTNGLKMCGVKSSAHSVLFTIANRKDLPCYANRILPEAVDSSTSFSSRTHYNALPFNQST